MSDELPKKVKIFADTAKSCERMSKKLEEAQDILDKAGEDVANAQAVGKSGWVHLSAAIGALRKLMRPDPDTVPWHTEIDYYLDNEPRLRWVSAGEYRTPNPALDFVLANPPIGNLPSGADGTERLRPGPTQIPYRKAAVELYNLGGLDFVRQEGDGERIVYTSLAAASGACPQPRLYRMTLFRRGLGGWTACIFNTFGALVAKLVFPLGKRGDCELAARRACAAIVARAFHKQRSQIRWRENRKARRLAEDGSPHQVVPEVPAVPEVPEVPAGPARPEEEAAR